MVLNTKQVFIIGTVIFLLLSLALWIIGRDKLKLYNSEIKPFGIEIGKKLDDQLKSNNLTVSDLKPTYPSRTLKYKNKNSLLILNVNFIDNKFKNLLSDADINLSQCKKNNLDEVYFERLETSFYKKSIKDHNIFYCYKIQELQHSLGIVNFTGYYTNYAFKLARPKIVEACENRRNFRKSFDYPNEIERYEKTLKRDIEYDAKMLSAKYGYNKNPFSNYKALLQTPSNKEITIQHNKAGNYQTLEYRWNFNTLFIKDKKNINSYLQCVLDEVQENIKKTKKAKKKLIESKFYKPNKFPKKKVKINDAYQKELEKF